MHGTEYYFSIFSTVTGEKVPFKGTFSSSPNALRIADAAFGFFACFHLAASWQLLMNYVRTVNTSHFSYVHVSVFIKRAFGICNFGCTDTTRAKGASAALICVLHAQTFGPAEGMRFAIPSSVPAYGQICRQTAQEITCLRTHSCMDGCMHASPGMRT